MNQMRILSLALAAGLLLAADNPAEEAVKKELEKFEGTWRYVAMEIEGAKAEEKDYKDYKLILKGDQFTTTDGKETFHGSFKVEPTQKPKKINVLFTDGPEKGQTALGIYELEGDTYKVCIAFPGKDRPTEFVSKPGSGHVLETLKREKR